MMKICLLYLTFLLGTAAQAQDVFIVVNVKSKIISLSSEELRDIYLGRKTFFSDNIFVRPIRLTNENEATKLFLDRYIKKTVMQYIGYWRSRLFAGEGTPPEVFNNEEQLLEHVGKVEDSIGYSGRKTDSSNLRFIEIKNE